MISPKIKVRIKRRMSGEKPTILIGKGGPTDNLVKEVSKQVDKNKVVKIKLLKSALKNRDADDIIQKITHETNSTLIDRRGHVFILYKPRKRKKPL
ncbi:MAG: YhbY family RNA-binding protein [Candidatus Bathyarchaeia archaeon]